MLVGFLWAAGLMIAYGLGAAMGISFFIGSNLCSRFAGSLGNPAYIGTYMIFALFFTAILANKGNEEYKKWLKFAHTALGALILEKIISSSSFFVFKRELSLAIKGISGAKISEIFSATNFLSAGNFGKEA